MTLERSEARECATTECILWKDAISVRLVSILLRYRVQRKVHEFVLGLRWEDVDRKLSGAYNQFVSCQDSRFVVTLFVL